MYRVIERKQYFCLDLGPCKPPKHPNLCLHKSLLHTAFGHSSPSKLPLLNGNILYILSKSDLALDPSTPKSNPSLCLYISFLYTKYGHYIKPKQTEIIERKRKVGTARQDTGIPQSINKQVFVEKVLKKDKKPLRVP